MYDHSVDFGSNKKTRQVCLFLVSSSHLKTTLWRSVYSQDIRRRSQSNMTHKAAGPFAGNCDMQRDDWKIGTIST